MGKQYKVGLIVTGDASGAVRAAEMTEQQYKLLNQSVKKNSKEMKAWSKQAKQSATEAESFSKALGSTANKVLLWAGGLSAASGGLSRVSAQLDAIDKIHKINLRLDASTEALSQYSHVAELSGTNIQQLSLAWQRSNRRIAEAAAGYGEARKSLKELNLDAKELVKLKPEDQFEAIAKALEKVESKADRLRLANKLFDSEGAGAALQIINQGTDAIIAMREEADRLGLTVSQELAQSVADFNDSIGRVNSALTGKANAFAGWLGDNFTDDLNNLAQVIAGNKDLMEEYGAVVTLAGGAVALKFLPALAKKAAALLEARAAVVANLNATVNATAAEHARATASLRTAQAAKAASLATVSSTAKVVAAEQAVETAVRKKTLAQLEYNRVATIGGTVTRGLSGALALIGGPVGVAVLAATGMVSYAASIDEAKLSANQAIDPIDQLALSMRRLWREMSGSQDDYEFGKKVEGFAKNSFDQLDGMITAQVQKIKELKASIASGDLNDSWYDDQQAAAESRLELEEKKLLALKKAQEQVAEGAVRLSEALGDVDYQSDKQNEANESAGNLGDSLSSLIELYDKKSARIAKLKTDLAALKAVETDDVEQKKRIAAAIKEINRQLKAETDGVSRVTKAKKPLLQQLEEEFELLKLSDKERAVQIQLRKLNAEATDEEKAKVRALVEQMYDFKASLAESKKEAETLAKQADPYAEAWLEATKRVDESFAQAWEGAYDSFDDFADAILGSFKKMLAEMAHLAITKPILVQLGFGGSLPGVGGGGGFNPLGFLSSGANMLGLGDGATSFLAAPFGYAANFGAATAAGAGTQQAMMLAEQSAAFGAEGAALTSEALGGTGSFFNPAALGPAAFAAIFGMALTGILTTKDGPRLTFGQGDEGDEGLTFSHTYDRTGKDVDIYGAGQVTDVYTEPFGDYVDTEFGRFGSIDNGFTKKLDGEFREYFDGVLVAVDKLDETIAGYLSDEEIQKVTDGLSATFLPEGHKLGLPGREGTDPDDQLVERYSQILETALPKVFADALLDVDDLTFEKLSVDMVAAFDLIEQSEKNLAVTAEELVDIYEISAIEGETLNQTLGRLNLGITSVTQATDITRTTFDLTGQAAVDASQAMIMAAGGLDALNAGAGLYYQEFYTQAEQADLAFAQITDQLESVNIALPESRDAFRAMVESIDLTTEAGQKQYALLMSMMGTIDAHYDHLEKTVKTPEERDQQARAARQAQAYQRAQDRRIQAEQKRYEQEQNLLKQLSSTLDSLLLSPLSTLKPEDRLGVAQSEYAALLAKVEGGDASAGTDLSAAAKAYLTEASVYYASSDSYTRIFAEVVDSLQGLALDIDPRFNLHGSHARGLERVPFDGYRAELHADKPVLPASIARIVRDAETSGTQQANAELAAEVKTLRQEMSQLLRIIGDVGVEQLQALQQQTAAIKRNKNQKPLMG